MRYGLKTAIGRGFLQSCLIGSGLTACLLSGGCTTMEGADLAQADRAQPVVFPKPSESAESDSQTQKGRSPAIRGLSQGYNRVSYTPGGLLQAAEVEFPAQPAAPVNGQRIKTADGYGVYNRPPVTDGTYEGPRVYTPYDSKSGAADTLPPLPDRDWDRTDPRYERDVDRRTSPFYGKSGDDGRGGEMRGTRSRERLQSPDRDASRFTRDRDGEPGGGDRNSDGTSYRGSAFSPDRPDDDRDRAANRGSRSDRGGTGSAASRETGKIVIVSPSDTLYSLAVANGVTVGSIAKANALGTLKVTPGQRLLIPAGPGLPPHREQVNVRKAVCEPGRCHVVKAGETAQSIAKATGIPMRRLLDANGLEGAKDMKTGQALLLPTPSATPVRDADTNGRTRSASVSDSHADGKIIAPKDGTLSASVSPGDNPAKGHNEGDTRESKTAHVTGGASSCDAALSNPQPRSGTLFRKPAEGLVTAQFGSQRDGTVNEGITISVPKGTPIKAAENGVVAYVGDELPGFGNLLLIRHADDYVTAYANADEITVKKCEAVRRGQVVGTAGTTGGATQPQLHFEIRKNSKPVDPAPLFSS